MLRRSRRHFEFVFAGGELSKSISHMRAAIVGGENALELLDREFAFLLQKIALSHVELGRTCPRVIGVLFQEARERKHRFGIFLALEEDHRFSIHFNGCIGHETGFRIRLRLRRGDGFANGRGNRG